MNNYIGIDISLNSTICEIKGCFRYYHILQKDNNIYIKRIGWLG
jgi:drug/metabolite transporter superfamily protein YnfA